VVVVVVMMMMMMMMINGTQHSRAGVGSISRQGTRRHGGGSAEGDARGVDGDGEIRARPSLGADRDIVGTGVRYRVGERGCIAAAGSIQSRISGKAHSVI
jgi:hypothetical protein